jgi:hypothetical protein
MIENAFSFIENLDCFVQYLNKNEEFAKKFIESLKDISRHKIGNAWQKEIIDQREAHGYLEKIRQSLDTKKMEGNTQTQKRRRTSI